MAQLTLNRPDNSRRPPNSGDGTEFGDSFDEVVRKSQANFTELYTLAGSDTAGELAVLHGVTAGTAAASKAVVLDASSKIDTLDITSPKINGVTVAASALEINQNCQASSRLVAAGATLTVTAALHAGRTIKLDTAGGSVCTLPAASGTGNVYRFLVTVLATSAAHIVKVANSSDIIQGIITTTSDDTSGAGKGWIAGASDDTITLNRTTTGSVARGEWFEIVDVAANLFLVRGATASNGAEATPFSATV